MGGNGWNPVELRDNRYNQIIHMVTAANGAEDFYTTEVIVHTIHFTDNTSTLNTKSYHCIQHQL